MLHGVDAVENLNKESKFPFPKRGADKAPCPPHSRRTTRLGLVLQRTVMALVAIFGFCLRGMNRVPTGKTSSFFSSPIMSDQVREKLEETPPDKDRGQSPRSNTMPMDTEVTTPAVDNTQRVLTPGANASSVVDLPHPIPTVSGHTSPVMDVQAPVAFASADPQMMGPQFFAESMVPGQTPPLPYFNPNLWGYHPSFPHGVPAPEAAHQPPATMSGSLLTELLTDANARVRRTVVVSRRDSMYSRRKPRALRGTL